MWKWNTPSKAERIDSSDWSKYDPKFIDDLLKKRHNKISHRILDLILSLVFIVFLLPLIVFVAFLIKLDSPGPILYRQIRVGLHGRPFNLLTFRTMRVDAPPQGPASASETDPRVTRVGSFLRRTRINTLLQLFNILRGEMSFVGPRPERPHFVEKLADEIPHYRERNLLKPGIVGWAQVKYPYGNSVEDARVKLSYDLYYALNRSITFDLRIILRMFSMILFGAPLDVEELRFGNSSNNPISKLLRLLGKRSKSNNHYFMSVLSKQVIRKRISLVAFSLVALAISLKMSGSIVDATSIMFLFIAIITVLEILLISFRTALGDYGTTAFEVKEVAQVLQDVKSRGGSGPDNDQARKVYPPVPDERQAAEQISRGAVTSRSGP